LIAVLSGDTVIIRPKELPEKGKPHKERYVPLTLAVADSVSVLHIAGLSAPRLGSASREDEVRNT
jgi:staphylococcal nuclease domain-containing protein 1